MIEMNNESIKEEPLKQLTENELSRLTPLVFRRRRCQAQLAASFCRTARPARRMIASSIGYPGIRSHTCNPANPNQSPCESTIPVITLCF